MKKKNTLVIFILSFLSALQLFNPNISFSQEQAAAMSADTMIIGDQWNPDTHELEVVFEDQTRLDLGAEGVLKVQFRTKILNGEGEEILWVVEYANGLRQEIRTQNVRFNSYRTYFEKTFRRNLWDAEAEKMVDVSGPCRILVVDNNQKDNIIIEMTIILE